MAIQFQPLSAGSGVVKIERKGTGIQEVPNSGLVEKLVFNTELTPTEVDTIISNANLTFVDFNGMPMYPIFVNEANEIGIVIINYGTLIGDGSTSYAIIEFGSSSMIYNSSTISSITNIDGWNFDLFTQLGGGNEFPVNMEANSTFSGLPVGSQNESIKELINIGGVEPYLKELKGTYEPIDIEITENTTIDIATQYMDNKQMPISLNIQTTSGTLDITTNGEHDVSKYEKANVNVQPNLQYKSLSLTSTSLTINPDSGFDGLSQVRVDVTSSIDSDIKAENIKKGVNILGVTGTYTGAQDYYNENVIEIVHNQYASFDVFKSYNAPNLTKIGIGAFKGCTSLETFNFNDNIMEIGNSAFMNCSGLYGDLVIPSLITQIEEQTFMKTNYSTVDLNNVTEIKLNAFAKCENLETISNGDKITKIGDSAFYKCSSLTSFTFNDNITYIGEKAFSNCNLTMNELIIPDLITVVNIEAFADMDNSPKKINTNNVTIIKESGFRQNSTSEEVVMPKVKTIENYGFMVNYELKKIDLYECEEIGECSFFFCPILETIIIRTPNKVCSIVYNGVSEESYTNTFGNCTSMKESGTCILYVPDSLVESYKADTSWQGALLNVNTQIKPLSEYVEA